MKNYTFFAEEVREPGYYNLDAKCNGVTIINQGNGAAIVNQVYLNASPLNVSATDRYAGESLAIGGNEGEILTGRLQVAFAPAVTQPLVIIVQKYYLPD